ncbi:MAG: hypothetical protein MJ118_04435 [Clostridia bacterium]|nr:hypothetical protein [Clostridia bacterium]
MNDFEQRHLPQAYKPLSPWQYFGLEILYALPLIGWIFLICHAIGSKNLNKRNFARSFFCVYLLAALIVAALSLLGVTANVMDLLIPA